MKNVLSPPADDREDFYILDMSLCTIFIIWRRTWLATKMRACEKEFQSL